MCSSLILVRRFSQKFAIVSKKVSKYRNLPAVVFSFIMPAVSSNALPPHRFAPPARTSPSSCLTATTSANMLPQLVQQLCHRFLDSKTGLVHDSDVLGLTHSSSDRAVSQAARYALRVLTLRSTQRRRDKHSVDEVCDQILEHLLNTTADTMRFQALRKNLQTTTGTTSSDGDHDTSADHPVALAAVLDLLRGLSRSEEKPSTAVGATKNPGAFPTAFPAGPLSSRDTGDGGRPGEAEDAGDVCMGPSAMEQRPFDLPPGAMEQPEVLSRRNAARAPPEQDLVYYVVRINMFSVGTELVVVESTQTHQTSPDSPRSPPGGLRGESGSLGRSFVFSDYVFLF